MDHHHHHHHDRTPDWVKELIQLLLALIEEIKNLIPGPPAAGHITFYAGGAAEMGEISAPISASPLSASVAWLDANGNPTTAADVPAWASDDEAVATVAAAEDGASASVTLIAAGTANITANTTDADGTVVTATGTVTVTPNAVASGDITFSEPAPAPAA